MTVIFVLFFFSSLAPPRFVFLFVISYNACTHRFKPRRIDDKNTRTKKQLQPLERKNLHAYAFYHSDTMICLMIALFTR